MKKIFILCFSLLITCTATAQSSELINANVRDIDDPDLRFNFGLIQLMSASEASENRADRIAEALSLIQKSAEQGHIDAQYTLGLLNLTQEFIPADYEKAQHWLNKAAEQNNSDAQATLAFMYAKGMGVIQNDETSFQWASKAAEQSNALGLGLLGTAYELGRGVIQNLDLAKEYYERACEEGEQEACQAFENIQ